MAEILRLEHENDVLHQRIAELETMVATRDHMLESMQKQVDDAKFFAGCYEELWNKSLETVRSMTENKGVETLYIVTVGDMQERFPDHKSALNWFADNHKPGLVWKFNKYINGQLC